jgi:hypothetical protein
VVSGSVDSGGRPVGGGKVVLLSGGSVVVGAVVGGADVLGADVGGAVVGGGAVVLGAVVGGAVVGGSVVGGSWSGRVALANRRIGSWSVRPVVSVSPSATQADP